MRRGCLTRFFRVRYDLEAEIREDMRSSTRGSTKSLSDLQRDLIMADESQEIENNVVSDEDCLHAGGRNCPYGLRASCHSPKIKRAERPERMTTALQCIEPEVACCILVRTTRHSSSLKTYAPKPPACRRGNCVTLTMAPHDQTTVVS